jgi:2-polyprenyl-3-methyl-5-hydroxy-6-metoxy-1,4-benzoquinol methylase
MYGVNKARYGTHRLIAEEIFSGKTVLDIGCNRGYLKTFAGDNIFYGIDDNADALQEAKKNGYTQVYQLDLNRYDLFKPQGSFDVIVCADILEHLMSPEKVLGFFVSTCLKRDGIVIISLPNIAHISVRIGLLLGNFSYAESGIMDKTHLHLYTSRTGRQLAERCNLEVVKEKFSSNHFGAVIRACPFIGSIMGYNLIFVCKKKY